MNGFIDNRTIGIDTILLRKDAWSEGVTYFVFDFKTSFSVVTLQTLTSLSNF